MERFVLVVESAVSQGLRLELEPEGPQLIGRGVDAALRLPETDLTISRYHAMVEPRRDGVSVRDLPGRGSTQINDRVVDWGMLRVGDKLRIGDTILRLERGTGTSVREKKSSQQGPAPRVDVVELGDVHNEAGKVVPPAQKTVDPVPAPPAAKMAPPLPSNVTQFMPAVGGVSTSRETTVNPAAGAIVRTPILTRCDECGRPPVPGFRPPAEFAWLCGDCVGARREPLREVPRRVGEFELLRVHGAGGMGVVFEAVIPENGTRAAVKVLRADPPPSDADVARFLREQRISHALRHPNIARCISVAQQPPWLFLATEYVPGGDATALDGMNTPIPVVVQLAADLFRALAHGHHLGIVHRDVKPANLLLTRPDKKGFRRGKLTDFGLAKSARELQHKEITPKGEAGGSILMLSPEQLQHFSVPSAGADLYSAAATIYRMLTGGTPLLLPVSLHDATIVQVADAVMDRRRTPTRALRPEVPVPVGDVLDALLAHDPQFRQRTTAAQAGEQFARWARSMGADPGPVL